MNRSNIFILSLGLLFGLFAANAIAQGTGMIFHSVVHEDPEDATSPVVQEGNAFAWHFPGWSQQPYEAHDFSLGFWVRREADDPFASQGVLINIPGTNDSEGLVVPMSVLGDDRSWHYVYLMAEEHGAQEATRFRVYVDPMDENAVSVVDTNVDYYVDYDYDDPAGCIFIGAKRSTEASGLESGFISYQISAPLATLVLDDITIFGNTSTNLDAFHRAVYRKGSSQIETFDLSGETLVKHFGMENETWDGYVLLRTWTQGSPVQTDPSKQFYKIYESSDYDSRHVTFDDRPAESVVAFVESEFGGFDKIYPRANQQFVSRNDPVTFAAPNEIYLDRYMNELTGTEQEISEEAYYKAVLEGLAIDEQDQDLTFGPTAKSITLNVDNYTTLSWTWGIEYAVIIDSATDEFIEMDDSLGFPIVNGASVEGQNRVGKHFVKANTLVSTAIDGIVIPGAPISDPSAIQRFTVRDFVVENAAQDLGYCARFSREFGMYLDGGATGIQLTNTEFTIEFWARMAPYDVDSDQNVICFGNTGAVGEQLRIGFRNDAGENAFFALDDNSGSPVELDPNFTDTSWHHWAVSYDPILTNLWVFRDGQQIVSTPHVLNFSGTDYLMIGAANNGGTGTNLFHGSVENVRIWHRTLDKQDVRASMAASRLQGAADLVLELTFDELDGAADFRGGNTDGGSNPVMEIPEWDPPLVDFFDPEIGEPTFSKVFTIETRIRVPVDADDGLRTLFAGDGGDIELGISSNELFTADTNGLSGYIFPLNEAPGDAMISMVRSNGTERFYRDGVLVATSSEGSKYNGLVHWIGNYDYANDTGQGTTEFGLMDEIRFWLDARTQAQILANVSNRLEGTEAGLEGYWNFNDGLPTDLTGNGRDGLLLGGATVAMRARSTVDPSHLFEMKNFHAPFAQRVSMEERLATVFPEFSLTQNLCPMTRIESDEFVIQDWLRLTWRWQKEFKLSIAVNSPAFLGLPFITPEREGCPNQTIQSTWVPERDSCLVGTINRTPSRHYTLSDVQGQQYIFTAITMATVLDGTNENQVATREYFFPQVLGPGSMTLVFDRTIFRAEIPLGHGLDVSSLTNLNVQLVPDLAVGGELNTAVGPGTPINTNPEELDTSSGHTAGNSGRLVLYDAVGQQELPLRPGAYRFDWPDKNDSSIKYLIEVVSDFPTETIGISWDREDDDGFRLNPDGNRILLAGGNYDNDVTMDPVIDAYPGSPLAHYRCIYQLNQPPPINLDVNPADRWAFDEVTLSTAGAFVQEDGDPLLNVPSSGKSVLLFSYTLDPTGMASGDPNREAYAVRLLKSTDAESMTQSNSVLSAGTRETLRVSPVDDCYVKVRTDGSTVSLTNGLDQLDLTFESWVNLGAEALTSSVDQVLFDFFGLAAQTTDSVQFHLGVRARTSHLDPAGWYLDYEDGYGNSLTNDFADMPVYSGWHHVGISIQSNRFRAFFDGNLLGEAEAGFTLPPVEWIEGRLGKSILGSGDGIHAELDNARVWHPALTVDELRQTLFSRRPDIDGSTALFELDFDQSTTGGGTVIPNSGLGTLDATLFSGAPDEALGLPLIDAHPEVATRILSKLDNSRLRTGYLMNQLANYNPNVYDRSAGVGAWGPIFPVNWGGIYYDIYELAAAWYENPYRFLPDSSLVLHVNVDWPYVIQSYRDVEFPSKGPNKDNRIAIASRLGSEGVDVNGDDQLVFDPATYANLLIYNQPFPFLPGYNPNEEHGLVADSIKDQITGNNAFNLGQEAAFALQHSLNVTGRVQSTFTSDPWVLTQVQNLDSGEFEMAAYRVEETRAGSERFPALDPVTHGPLDPFDQPVAQPADPMYDFDYPSFAGDVLIPPYPLNQVIGASVLTQSDGGNIKVDGINQRTLWEDLNGTAWVIAGDGRFFYEYWYPMRNDFWFDSDGDRLSDLNVGTPVAWLPDNNAFLDGEDPDPVDVRYSTYWRSGYPVLKRGETLTYAGGEYKAENASAEGLPAVLAFASAQIIYDSRTPSMTFNAGNAGTYSARITRPLDRLTVDMAAEELPTSLTPSYTDNIMVDGSRWYFKALTGSLQKRFYYDALTSQLVFRGRVNDLETGDPDLTVTPVSLSILEPNVLTASEYWALLSLSSDSGWRMAVNSIYAASQNPHAATGVSVTATPGSPPAFFSGLEDVDPNATANNISFYSETGVSETVPGSSIASVTSPPVGSYQPVDSLGVGAALAPHPAFLTETNTAPQYVTVVENNHADAGGAISLHIIRLGQERFRGAIKVVEAQNVFDEKINLRHTGDFGGNVQDVYYQWWVRQVDSLDTIGLPEGDDVAWQIYEEGLGLHQIEFAGRPDIMLADSFFYVRYGEGSEFEAQTNLNNVVTDDLSQAVVEPDSWRLVDINSTTDTYANGVGEPVPFQWAGAANSPQLQADGSKRFIPQLVMGWVKRVLDRINPYEARYNDFYNNESPATYSSMLQIVGPPYIGPVALNSDKDVIENVGLIQLYETVLARARGLTLDIPGASTTGTDQALLLAATRLAFLYNLLAQEAYTDAQNPLIRVTHENGMDQYAPYVHAFYNQQDSLLSEELALLRGTDFLVAYPAYNRLFWNYVKGEGEAAYNANYNVYDVNEDGFINEFDAATLYPQGHGDAWGHFMSANRMHYELLVNNAFDWNARAEYYSLLDNVIEADYLDEQSFARIAAAKARAGVEILKGTYRRAYTADPDGQWQGYRDPDSARAWGVGEWAKRTGHAALFDWAVGHAILPEESEADLDSLEHLDRRTAHLELGELAAALHVTQTTIDGVNIGRNPVGMHSDALIFDLDPLRLDGNAETRATHFEQVYEHAVQASQNALAAQTIAARADQQLMLLANDTIALQFEALRQDMDYRNRLIELFGRPYEGTIGVGKVYPEGYDGPDTMLYQYLDRADPEELVPTADTRFLALMDTTSSGTTTVYNRVTWGTWEATVSAFQQDSLSALAVDYRALDWNPNWASIGDDIGDLFDRYYLTGDGFDNIDSTFGVPVSATDQYAFLAEGDWGNRSAHGRIQNILNDMLVEEIAMKKSIRDYAEYVEQVLIMAERLKQELRAHAKKEQVRSDSATALTALYAVNAVAAFVEAFSQWGWDFAWQSAQMVKEYFPTVLGFSSDVTSPARGAAYTVGLTFRSTLMLKWTLGMVFERLTDAAIGLIEAQVEGDETIIGEFREMNAIVAELGIMVTKEESIRLAVAEHLQRMQILANDYQSAVAEGFRLLDEREAFNIALSSKAQRNRYRDMILRLSRNDAMAKYQSAFDTATRYAWLSAKAYDYETSLDEGDPAAVTTILDEIVRTRTLGEWVDGEPRIGQGGLAATLAQLRSNFDVLEGQLGINNPQLETGMLSLRHELFRISRETETGDTRWARRLQDAYVDDLWALPEFRRYCRPFADPSEGAQPGFVLEFSTEILSGHNVFGNMLGSGDHAYSAANFATKIRSAGVWFEGYEDADLSITPRVYLVPTGVDRIRVANSDLPQVRTWNILEQRIPVPYAINQNNIISAGYIPAIDSLDGTFSDLKRFGDFRAYAAPAGLAIDPDQLHTDNRLVARSVWNSRWMLIIPAAALHGDSDHAQDAFIEHINDIRLVFETYSHSGN